MTILEEVPVGARVVYNSAKGVVEVWQDSICIGILHGPDMAPMTFEEATSIPIDVNTLKDITNGD